MRLTTIAFRLSFFLAISLSLVLSGCGGEKVSRSNFDKVRTDMAEEEIDALLGAGGREIPASKAPPNKPAPAAAKEPKEKIKVWQDGQKSITVLFRDGKVSQKSSKGL